MPKFICPNCIVDLNNSYKFKIKCELTDHKLRFLIEAGMTLEGNVELTENRALNVTVEMDANNMLKPIEDTYILPIGEREDCPFGMVLTPIEEDGDEQIAEDVQITENYIFNEQISPNSNANCSDRMQITETDQSLGDLSQSCFDDLAIDNDNVLMNNQKNSNETLSSDRRRAARISSTNMDNSDMNGTPCLQRSEDNFDTISLTSESEVPQAEIIVTNWPYGSSKDHEEQETSTEQIASEHDFGERSERSLDCNKREIACRTKNSLRTHFDPIQTV